MKPEYFIPLVVALLPFLALLFALLLRHQRIKARYQLLMHLADKGLALPDALLIEQRSQFCERRRGIVLIGAGLGLIISFLALPIEFENGQKLGQLWGFGVMPIVLGIAYLCSWWLRQRDEQA